MILKYYSKEKEIEKLKIVKIYKLIILCITHVYTSIRDDNNFQSYFITSNIKLKIS